jgi:flagellar motor switch protein FliM
VSSNVVQEEVEALLSEPGGGEARAAEVVQCDFSRPRRLSPERLEELQEALAANLGASQESLSRLLGLEVKLELASLSEVHADSLFRELPEHLALMRFQSAGHPNWVRWESLPAIRCVERLLGSTTETEEERELSSIEVAMLEGIVNALVQPMLAELSPELSEVEVITDLAAAGSWRDAAEGADPHRLGVELALDAPGIQSTLNLFLSGFADGTSAGAAAAQEDVLPDSVPAHLEGVTTELQACLAGVDVPLSQLLSLEEGDVIPIDMRAGHPVTATLDGRAIATAEWGTYHGRMALKILGFDLPEEAEL